MRAILIPHPASEPGDLRGLTVELEREEGLLWLRFAVDDDPDLIVWPRTAAPERTDELWKHTCLEAFVAFDGGYMEFNLSPSGQWASYRFDAYRQGMRPADEVAVVSGLDAGRHSVALEARIELPIGATRLGLSAVIERVDGERTYWAIAHPSDKPDFHHPDSFVLDLP